MEERRRVTVAAEERDRQIEMESDCEKGRERESVRRVNIERPMKTV